MADRCLLGSVQRGHESGVFEEEEDGSALAPPAADILNLEAVTCFLRHTHERYSAHLKEHCRRTIVKFSADEPFVDSEALRTAHVEGEELVIAGHHFRAVVF